MPTKKPSSRTPVSGSLPNGSSPSELTRGGAEVPLATFPVVAVAASAGGLEALRVLLSSLPDATGMAFVVIQHLDPTHESLLADVLSRCTGMRVTQVRAGVRLAPNCVYIIPPNADIAIRAGAFLVSARDSTPGHFMPGDHFLRSLAEDAGPRAIGVVLSGTGSDGARGMEAVRHAGGTTFAQDGTARHDGMPRAAIATGCVDFVLSPDAIAAELARIARHPGPSGESASDDPHSDPEHNGTVEGPVAVADPEFASRPLNRIFELLRDAMAADFSLYRRTSVSRRIEHRMAFRKLDNLDDYAELLERNPAELEALYGELLIKVTGFFRDPEAFTALQAMVFPELTRRSSEANAGDSIRIWVPACATGEEAYSVAIALLEYLAEHRLNPRIQIFATDLNDEAIGIARSAVYPESIAADVSPERLRRYFVKHQAGYQVDKSVRDLCVFARQNVATDPPFSRLDLISCRNLLIYLEPVLQKRVIATFHYALRPHGSLLLGTSETIGASANLFEAKDKRQKIYARRQNPAVNGSQLKPGWFESRHGAAGRHSPAAGVEAIGADLQKEADRLVLDSYCPPGVIIDEAFSVVQYRGKTAAWLEIASGKPSLNLLRMVSGAMLPELRNAVQKAKRTGQPVGRTNVPVERNRGHEVAFEVIPLQPQTGARHFLILFFDSIESPSHPPRSTPGDKQQIEQLRQELAATRQYLQSVIDEQEAANEEMQSANEEILSSNEELQSINEELETAKEELQATNEELATVNEELQNRNTGLRLNNDELNDVLSGVNIAIVTVGNDLSVRRFTPVAGRMFNLIPSDIGRPVTDLDSGMRWTSPAQDLGQMIREVLDSGNAAQCIVTGPDGHRYSLSIRPNRPSGVHGDGAVIVLADMGSVQSA